MNKKKIVIIVSILIIGILSTIGVILYSENKQEDNTKEIKKSAYTLEEIYKLVEQPEEFLKLLNNHDKDNLAYILFHFYDYFNESTPFKIVNLKTEVIDGIETLVKVDGKYVIDNVEYIDYYDFQRYMGPYYQAEKDRLKQCEENNEKESCPFVYTTAVKDIVYHYNSYAMDK